MEQRRLGSSDLRVGAIGLGCMGMSWAYGADERDDEESVAVIRRAVELGVTLLDTADSYGPYTNEELVGRAVAELPEDGVVVATKCGLVVDPDSGQLTRNGKPEHVRSACDASLRRLGTDVLDLYQLHRVDPAVPVEDTWGAMSGLVQAGKVQAIGLSEVGVDELVRATAIHPVATLQSELSLWTQDALDEVLPWCALHDVAFLAFAPLGRGFLTGRIPADEEFRDDDFRARNPRFQPDALRANQAIVDGVRRLADRRKITPAQVALAWVLSQGDHVVPIPGTKKLRYLEDNAAAADIELSKDDLAELASLPPAVGTRY